MKEKREGRYYRIRTSVFWGIVGVVAVAVFVLLAVQKGITVSYENRVTTVHMEYGKVVSELKNKEECYLCGNANESLMGYYRNFDAIGVIGLNEWHILDLGLKKYDSEGNLEEEQNGGGNMFGHTQGMNYNVSSTPSRGMASATISSENGMFDEKVVKEHLCQKCLNKVTETLVGYFEKGKEEYVPFCIVDFKTLEVYPVQKQNVAYFVRDYWVDLEYSENEIEVDVFYLPEK